MKQTLYILSILTLVSCSTTNKMVVGGDWTGYDYSYFCPSYCFSEGGKIKERLDILNKNKISLATNNYKEALDRANEYINNRGGTAFLHAVYFADMDITYKDSIENFKNKRPLYDVEKCGQTKYYIRFLFNPSKDIDYRFGVALTEDFKVISKSQFPDFKTSPDFSKIIKPKVAIHIAKQKYKKIISPIKSIELIYDEQLNYFIWEIDSERKTKENPYEYETGFVKINATSGQILDSGNKKGRMLFTPSF